MKISIEQLQSALPDRYQLTEKLTEKSDRQTWLAQDKQETRSVVLKILRFSGPSLWKTLTHFEREAEFLQQISHPAIPDFLDYFDLQVSEQHSFVLVQQYIPARSLNQHREDGRIFSEADIKEIIQQVLEILHYLHQQDPPILHRDIKPSNLLLGDRSAHSVGQIYLVDFGAAKTVTESVGKTLTVVGSYGYAPIEQFGGRAVAASDIYSLGATIIYLLTGRHPAELPQVDLSIQFEATTNISLGLKNWISHATQPFVDRRFANAEVALEELMNPIDTALSNSASQTITRPFGTQITCDRFDTFLQIKHPIIDPNRARAIVLKELVSRLLVYGFSIIVSLILATFPSGIIAVLFGTQLSFISPFSGLIVYFLIAISLMVVLIRGENKGRPHLFCRLIRLEYQISKTEIRCEWWFLFKRHPQVKCVNRSDIQQIDRTLAHRAGQEYKDVDGKVYVRWRDIAGKIELRSETLTFRLENLKEPEIDWLCSELSDYLDIPIVTQTIGKQT